MSGVRQITTPRAVTIRPTEEDYRLLAALMKKLGINASSVTRQAWRLLAAREKVKRKA